MPPSYSVQAQVVDIRNLKDTPKATDAFLVDTNVWLWLTYTRLTSTPTQAHHYPNYLRAARNHGAKCFWCGLSLAELAHRIEATERQIFETTNGVSVKAKEFRHNYPNERPGVVAEVRAAWGMVKSLAQPLDLLMDEPTTDAALNRFQTQPLDGYDLFMLEAIDKAGIVQVLTDDGDYATVPNIQVFTANVNVVQRAQANGKLLIR